MLLLCACCCCCCFADSAATAPDAPAVVEVGCVKAKSLVEASGLVRSRRGDDVFWTHNDGDDGVLYAIRRDGTTVARVRLAARFRDWEDVARAENGDLLLADTGNNSRDRKFVTVYRIAEPDPDAAPADVKPVQEWKLTFPAKPFNCEALFVWKEHAYLISKTEHGHPADVYRFALAPAGKGKRQLEHVTTLTNVDEPVTAADISDDGRQLAVLSRGSLRVFGVDGEIKDLADKKPARFAIPPIQSEGCCFTPDGVLVIAETGELLLVRDKALLPATTQPAP
jgi:hypothetical protein